MQLHELKPKTKNKKHRQVGRGGRRGKTSGKGHKGQKARAGHRIRPHMRDIIKKLPKKRGYKFKSLQTKPVVVKLSVLEEKFASGATVSPTTLLEKGILSARVSLQAVKILDEGSLTKKLTISGCAVSQSVRAKIEKAGGSVEGK